MSPTTLADVPAGAYWDGDHKAAEKRKDDGSTLVARPGTTSHPLGVDIRRPAHDWDEQNADAAANTTAARKAQAS